MNLTSFVSLNNGFVNNVKLSKPQMNLLAKLDAMGVVMSPIGAPRIVTNNSSGYSGLLNPFIATLVEWVYKTYSTYDYTGAMNYRGTKVAIGIFDRVRYLILALDNEAFSNFID